MACNLMLLAALLLHCDQAALERYSRRELHMGVEFEVVLYAAGEAQAREALDRAMTRIAELDSKLSDYQADSELSRLAATSDLPPGQPLGGQFPAVKLSDDLWRVLAAARQVSDKSGGAFDVTVGPLTKLWRRARRQRELPEPERLATARDSVGYRFLELDSKRRTARLLRPNMRLDLGGIAKGFAADEAVRAVQELGIRRVLVRASGDIVAGDPPPDESGWLVGIAPLDPDARPQRFVSLANRAISTSGDARQHLVIDGRRYSHILDARTGVGIDGRSSVTVIADCGTLSDALASAASVLGPDGALDLIRGYEGVELLMIHEDASGRQRIIEAPGLAKYEVPPPRE